ncbi:hypothetical protein ACFQFH_14595 [Halobaculum halobium]|uniref:DUF8152 domain-containing protein n=1 Tax=Halobaculum halobium TaxID=3032281 RepID=A0ABD5TDF2_9EURY|nr:hypothetical protein [Halobaculum sp. SYNS20]
MSDDAPADPEEVDDPLEALHGHLAATAERPVARAASAHLGEAEAVARDLAERPADPDTVRERVSHVIRLLREAGDTEDETADEHVAAALTLAQRLIEESSDRDGDST